MAERSLDRITSGDLVQALVEMEDRAWPEYRAGRPITSTGIARLLAPFGIAPAKWKDSGRMARGYTKQALNDAFTRYLGNRNATAATALKLKENSQYPNATRGAAVADGKSKNVNENNAVAVVADGIPGGGECVPFADDWGGDL